MNPISKATIFYFSGTGNAQKIAKWFCEQAERHGVGCRAFDIATHPEIQPLAPDALVMIVSPVHGFIFPKTTLDFIRRFPRGRNRVVVMNTRAGMKLGRWVTPGISGASLIFSSLILKIKGYRVVGAVPFDMPSNWIALHPMLNDNAVTFINRKNESRVERHAERIFSGRNDFWALRDLIQDILTTTIALAYWLAGRFYLAKSLYATDACIRCGICEKRCPTKAIRHNACHPYWTFRCESCMRCVNICPARAIEVTHGLSVVLIISSILLARPLYGVLSVGVQSGWLKFAVFCAVMFVLLCLLYPLQHLLLRNRAFAKLISHTSLTHYKFWGRFFNGS